MIFEEQFLTALSVFILLPFENRVSLRRDELCGRNSLKRCLIIQNRCFSVLDVPFQLELFLDYDCTGL